MFTGSIVALVTPMKRNGSIDKKALNALLDWHLESKTEGVVIAGTTGESPTLSEDEKIDLFKHVVKYVKKRMPVIAGTGTNDTRTTVALSVAASKCGVDGLLVVTPYYNKPTQEGLYQHFKHVAEAVTLPIILYNVPGRTACDLLPDTIKRLSAFDNIIAVKEASGKVDRVKEILGLCRDKITVLSGDDATALSAMLHGAKGVISVVANVAPEKMHAMCEAAISGKTKEATRLNNELSLLHARLFLEANPIPTKFALTEMGKIKDGIRLPLLPLDKIHHDAVKEAMKQAGVISCITSEQ